MKSLINRAIEEFLRATYGEDLVQSVADEEAVAVGRLAPLGAGFGTGALERAAFRLSKPLPEMFEDLGGWMTRIEPVRRLLRFSGRDFKDFLLRLEELPGRAHLGLPDLQARHLQVGLIRGMADDYGALCLISVEGLSIRIDIWDEQFFEGRIFSLQGAQLSGAVSS